VEGLVDDDRNGVFRVQVRSTRQIRRPGARVGVEEGHAVLPEMALLLLRHRLPLLELPLELLLLAAARGHLVLAVLELIRMHLSVHASRHGVEEPVVGFHAQLLARHLLDRGHLAAQEDDQVVED